MKTTINNFHNLDEMIGYIYCRKYLKLRHLMCLLIHILQYVCIRTLCEFQRSWVQTSNLTEGSKHFSAILIFTKYFNLHWRKSQFLIDLGSRLCGNQMLWNVQYTGTVLQGRREVRGALRQNIFKITALKFFLQILSKCK